MSALTLIALVIAGLIGLAGGAGAFSARADNAADSDAALMRAIHAAERVGGIWLDAERECGIEDAHLFYEGECYERVGGLRVRR